MIIFSDEEEQTYLRDANDPEGPGRPITEGIVEDAVRAGINLKVYAFASDSFPRHWEDITLAGNGSVFELTSNAVSMYNDLMSIIDEACLPREPEAEEQGASLMSDPDMIYFKPILWVSHDIGWHVDWASQYTQYLDFERAMCVAKD